MVVEQQNKDLVIRIPRPVDMRAAQKLLDYFGLMESIAKNQGTEEQATELAREAQKNWWAKNRSRFIK